MDSSDSSDIVSFAEIDDEQSNHKTIHQTVKELSEELYKELIWTNRDDEKCVLNILSKYEKFGDNVLNYCISIIYHNQPSYQTLSDIMSIFYMLIARNQFKLIEYYYHLCCRNNHKPDLSYLVLNCTTKIKVIETIDNLQPFNPELCHSILMSWSCNNESQDIAEWLYYVKGIDIRYNNDEAFKLTCLCGNIEKIKWFCQIYNGYSYEICNEFNQKYYSPIIKDNIKRQISEINKQTNFDYEKKRKVDET
jgi:hypothetical protein